jgi:hypothetical protein
MANQFFSTQHLDYLQRSSLDLSALEANSPLATSTPPELRRLWRIHGVGRTGKWLDLSRDPHVLAASEDAFIGLDIPLAFLISGTSGGTAIHVGTWSPGKREKVSAVDLDDRQGILSAAMHALHPAIELEDAAVELNRPPLSGLVLGVPTAKSPDSDDGALGLDKLIRAMSGTNWACLVLAEPLTKDVTINLRNSALNELRNVQTTAQAEGTPSPLAAEYSDLLTVALKASSKGLDIGLWSTGVYLLGDRQSYGRLVGVWRLLFSGDDSLPEPVRVWDSEHAGDLAVNWTLPDTPGASGPGHYRHFRQFQTLLTSNQLAAYVHLPRLETSGFAIRTVADFDAVPPATKGDNPVALGEVILRTRPTGVPYSVDLNDLTRHAFVSGITDSGKTNTIFHILKQVADSEVPFLVLEPAKTEYRELLDAPNLHGRLQVFTLGDEQTSPFRLNPFEVVGWPKISIGSHLDMLRSVISSSFSMWTPLPQILERCLHAVYRDRGWDIVSNTNYRWNGKSDVADTFPTLAELVAKAEEILPQLGYEAKIVDDMRTALLTRLNGLRAGTKGRMLDVQRSLPMRALVDRPTVLELEGVGADDDKAFLMALMLTRLYEYRCAGNEAVSLQHVIVIEEAHRLLTNVGPRRGEEEADPRAKAVEVFVNLLAEIRAYGQGVIVADQSPVKLASEIIKNTNLKIAHRVVAADDRMALAGAMAMDEREAVALATLTKGQAAVFGGGDDRPVLVLVPLAKGEGGKHPPDDVRVKAYMSSSEWKAGVMEPLLPDIDMSQPRAYTARDAARALVDDPIFRRDFVRLVLSITENSDALDRLQADLILRAQAVRQATMDGGILFHSLIVYAAAWFARRRGTQEAWSYADAAELEEKLRDVLLAQLEGKDVRQQYTMFRAVMERLHARGYDPFPGCEKICTQRPAVCLYRRAVADLINISTENLSSEWNKAYLNDKNAGGSLPGAWQATRRASDDLLEWHPTQADGMRRIRLCYAQQMLRGQFPQEHQSILQGLIDEASTHDGGANHE